MKIDSLAFQTDLFFHRFTGIILEYDDYLIVKNPNNPSFFWGNLIYFKKPPSKESFFKWRELFQKEFNALKVEHMTFAWDSIGGETGEIQSFLADGFNLETSCVMVAEKLMKPKKFNHDLIIRPIENDREWEMVIENQIHCRANHFEEIPYRKFTVKRISDYRKMIKQNHGVWLGAFLENTLVGDLGLFHEGGLGRFQVVETHPDFRRVGVCSTLLYYAGLYGIQTLKINQFVIVADPKYHAAKIYESVGFLQKETQIGMCKFNKKIWAT